MASSTSIGCGPNEPLERFSVTGEVTLDRKPVTSAMIRFIAEERSGDVVGVVTAGNFRIDQERGLTPGQYDVVVLPENPELAQAMQAIQSGDRDPLKSRTIPVRYQQAGLLHATVDPDTDNHYRFELTTR
ncbi:carboxypeptidase regulatory-like domain-containing protein [Neorhodopirellula lusitana]|uniref:carboxypeptidase regulatory-like domain-containing protein n=1 Tax=Neorhodopirellula lusitana TaxID=445327 RepID=UPI0024B8573C|nr:carboxypeptidase regulatory-like domain-containing protein [Neorhodopirellula lusitana]